VSAAPWPAVTDACGCASPAGRRAFLASLLAAVAAACAGPGAAAQSRRQRDLLAQGAAAVAAAPVVDLHAHPGAFTRASTGELPHGALDDMRAGGVDVAFFAAVADGLVIRREPGRIRQWREPEPGELYRNTRGQLERVLARARAGHVQLALSARAFAPAAGGRPPGALLAIEGGDALEGDAARVREFHAMGVRSIQLVHYRVNELGDIQTEPARHGGLTRAGRDVIAEMNRLGMIVDAAHASPGTLRDILSASRTPVIVSHTGPAALRSVQRHLADDLLRLVAARGGLIGVWPMAARPAGLGQWLDDIDHVRRVAGLDHVGIGTDMAGLSTFTVLPTYRGFPELPAALLARGYPEADVRKILGGNLARVFEATAAS
jgi:membrane dipeptidase